MAKKVVIHLVTMADGRKRLVQAATKARAFRFAAEKEISVEYASQIALAEAIKAGVEIEVCDTPDKPAGEQSSLPV